MRNDFVTDSCASKFKPSVEKTVVLNAIITSFDKCVYIIDINLECEVLLRIHRRSLHMSYRDQPNLLRYHRLVI